MLDLGWPELAVVAVLAVLILGPKELPTAMRTIARWVKRIRGLAREFQGHLDDVVREAELQEVRDGINKARRMDIGGEIEKHVDPTGEFSKDLNEARKDMDIKSVQRQAAATRPTEDPARPVAEVAEAAATEASPTQPAQQPGPAQSTAAEPERPAAGGKGT